VNPGTISELERGVREPYPATLGKIAAALEIPIEELTEAPKANAPPSSEPSFGDVLAEERRADILDALQAYTTRRARAHNAELQDRNSPHFKNATAATLWVEFVRKEGTMWSNWALEHASALMPRNGGLFDVSAWRSALKVLGTLADFHQIARNAERRIQAMSDQPDELAQRRAEETRSEAEESEQRLRELQSANG
jgi:transcriptional regulator with XRE-family HTH domain